jgi:glycosyltransferase involved in cell wall biosynthesis
MTTSVALCTYNGSRYLKDQLESILSQTLPVDEIVVCDDGSTDQTIPIINFYQQHFPFIRLVNNDHNLGGKKNFEKALSLCTGDTIFLCDQDDVWEEQKVETIVQYLQENEYCEGVFHNASITSDTTLWQALNFTSILPKLIPAQLFKAQLMYRNFVTGACLVIRRSALSFVLPFKLMEHMWHDEWIALVLAKRSSLHWINKNLARYRIHGDQQTRMPAELNNKELDEVSKAIFAGNLSLYPLYSYFHFKRRIEHVKNISGALEVSKQLIHEMEQKKRKGLVEYFRGLGYYERKRELVKWLLKKEDVSLKDVITI